MEDNGRNYTKNAMEKYVTTQLFSKVFWNDKDVTKNKRLELNMFNNSLQFVMSSMGEDKKFTSGERVVCTMNINFSTLFNVVQEMKDRLIKIIDKNENVDKEAIIIYSGRNLKDANSKVEFNIYTATGDTYGNKFSGYIKLTNKKEDKTNEAIIWLGGSKSLFRGKEEKPAKDYDVYELFQELEEICKGVLSRSSVTRDNHLKKYLETIYGDRSNNNENTYKGKQQTTDDEDYPY